MGIKIFWFWKGTGKVTENLHWYIVDLSLIYIVDKGNSFFY